MQSLNFCSVPSVSGLLAVVLIRLHGALLGEGARFLDNNRQTARTLIEEERMKKQYAQGDVLLTKVDKLPEGTHKLKTKTIARGELTGHHHTFEGPATLYADENMMWVVIEEPGAFLVHQEHTAVEFGFGVWEYSAQIEPDPFLGVRRVSD